MKKYNKIKYMGDDENKNMFKVPDDEIIIQEKIDGANFRFWFDEGIKYGSRNVEIEPDNQQFKEIIEYLEETINQENIDPDLIYVGEAMIKHSISYPFDDLPKFIGYDCLHKDTGLPVGYSLAKEKFKKANINFINTVYRGKAKDWKNLEYTRFLEKSAYRKGKPEGIVVKNYERCNQYGRPFFAKIINDEFQEKKKAKFDSSNIGKSNTPLFIENYITENRIRKIVNKMVKQEGKSLSRRLMGSLIHRVSKDALVEHITDAYENKNIEELNFNMFGKFVPQKCLKVIDKMVMKQVEEE